MLDSLVLFFTLRWSWLPGSVMFINEVPIPWDRNGPHFGDKLLTLRCSQLPSYLTLIPASLLSYIDPGLSFKYMHWVMPHTRDVALNFWSSWPHSFIFLCVTFIWIAVSLGFVGLPGFNVHLVAWFYLLASTFKVLIWLVDLARYWGWSACLWGMSLSSLTKTCLRSIPMCLESRYCLRFYFCLDFTTLIEAYYV